MIVWRLFVALFVVATIAKSVTAEKERKAMRRKVKDSSFLKWPNEVRVSRDGKATALFVNAPGDDFILAAELKFGAGDDLSWWYAFALQTATMISGKKNCDMRILPDPKTCSILIYCNHGDFDVGEPS